MPTAGETLQDLRQRWWREHELINHRLNWLGFIQTILFTAYAFSFEFRIDIDVQIAIAGIVTASLILCGTGAAVAAQIILGKKIKRKDSGESLGVNTISTVLGWMPPIGIPVACLVAWVYLFAVFDHTDCAVDAPECPLAEIESD